MSYCKKCGSEIDINTKRCTGCGKQYLKVTLFTLLLTIMCVFFMATTAYYYKEKQKAVDMFLLQEKLINQEFKNRFGHLQNPTTGEYITGYETYLKALDEQEKVHGTVYAYNNGLYFHVYDCDLVDFGNENIIVMNRDNAISDGYKPCAKCCK